MLGRVLKIYSLFLSQNIKKELIYRTNFLMLLAIDLVGMGVPVVFFSVLFGENETLAGWSFPATLILIGSVGLLRELAYLTFRDGLGFLGEEIRRGRFDLVLTKPFPPQLLVSFKQLSLTESIGEGLAGFFLIGYGFIHLGVPVGGVNIVLFLLLLILSYLLYYAVVLLVNATSFWIVKTEGLNALVWSFMEMARYPRDILKGVGKLIFTFVIPISLIATVPATALVGRFDWGLTLTLALLAVIFLLAANFVWRQGVKHYNSASS